MFAKVIVDVPARQTNRAFDYRVPVDLQEWVAIGSRVGVPFGPRIVQGFVVGIQQETVVETDKLRDIDHVLDLSPPLTPELVELARWMSRKYLCHEITALQVMIPGALKAKYERHLSVSEDWINSSQGSSSQGIVFAEEMQIISFLKEKGSLPTATLLRRFPDEAAAIKRLLKVGALTEIQTMKNRLNKKKAWTVFPTEQQERLRQLADQLPAGARRQKEVLHYLQERPWPIRLSELMRELDVGAGTVKGLADKGWIELKEVEVFRDPYAHHVFPRTLPITLTAEQEQVFQHINVSIQAGLHEVYLLHGVTGSGKTEVYLQSIQQCLDQGKEAIVLVPEISLTPQMVERFKGRFGNEVAVLHSRLSDGERYDEWRKISRNEARVAIGARSAVFAPLAQLGLIIIDEEHETSYKQEDNPKYHARDVAIRRAEQAGAVVILGSATPSLESYQQTEEGFQLLSMPSRVEGRPMPEVHVVDMREELKAGNRSMFSRSLYKALEERLHKKEQTVLLLNRRGYATFIMCRSCGFVAQCTHCDISLTYHQSSRALRCHYCGYAEREATTCPDCGSEHIRHFGTGTQRVEEELAKLFPGIRVIRMDVDTTTEKGSHEKLLTMFRKRQADVLLGTQMVAKGLDFPFVTLVGVIAADTVLNLPDFRAAEKTFQLLTQVAGRAGRHQLPGEVFVQTYTPEHYSIDHASRHDFNSFVHTELGFRRERNYPPFHKLILITLAHEQLPLLLRCIEALTARLRELVSIADASIEVLGPVASPIPRIKDRYRFQCMVKYQGCTHAPLLVQQALEFIADRVSREKMLVSVDVDPQMLL